MTPNQIIEQAKTKLGGAISHFEEELKKLRTGRAHPSMLEGITVEAYGQPMPLIQVATVTTPEAQLLQIAPFDPNNLQTIVAAIRDNQSLGMNPMDDGRVIRVPVPPLTAERRQQIAKQLGEKVEDCMIAMRAVRSRAMKDIDQAKKDKDIGEDDHKRLSTQIDQLTAEYKNKTEVIASAKEQEILTL